MANLIFTINVVAPVFLMILTGIVLKKRGLIDEPFIRQATNLVFKVSLPALLFSQIAVTDFSQLFDGALVLLGVGGTLIIFLLAWGLSLFIKEPASQGPFIQGSFRGNVAIVGFALIMNLLGQEGLSRGAILLSFLLPLFNILSVVALTVPLHKGGPGTLRRILINILKNPLILSVLAALPFSILSIALPPLLLTSLGYLARISLPLALLGIGGSLTFASMKYHALPSLAAAFLKLVVLPLSLTAAAWFLGFRGTTLGLLFVFFGCPTAISSFVMAQSMGNDHHLAANIVAVTTLGSIFTLGTGIYILVAMGAIVPV